MPFADLLGEMRTACFMQHEVGCIEDPEWIFMNGRRVILHAFGRRGTAEDASVRLPFAVNGDDEVVLVHMLTHPRSILCIVSHLQNDAHALQPLDGRLIVQIEGTDGFDLVIEKLQPQRFLRLPGEKVHDAAAAGELATLGDDGHAFVTCLAEITQEVFEFQLRTDGERTALAGNFGQRRCGLVQTVRAQHHDRRVVFHHAAEHAGAFRQQFGIDQGIVHHLSETRKIQGRALPHAEFGMHMILRLHVRTENPDATPGHLLLRMPHQ